jgi:hypothetical protein
MVDRKRFAPQPSHHFAPAYVCIQPVSKGELSRIAQKQIQHAFLAFHARFCSFHRKSMVQQGPGG